MEQDTEEDENGILAGRSKGRNRVRNLLSAYYGLGRPAGPGIDELDLDSPHFNAEQYTAKVLKEKALDEILRHDSSLVTESKTLASDLQMMVYENYSKFLSSLDTLRLMKQNMQTMEEQMHLLSEKMDGITKSASAINEALAPKRDQVANLAGVDLTLKKIHFLLELPQSLRKCVDRQAYGAAVRCYTVGSNILGKYSHIRSFQHIQEESHKVMMGLTDKLKEVLRLPLSRPENVAQVRGCLHLLAELDPSGISDHHDRVLLPIEASLDTACDSFMASIDAAKRSTCSAAAVAALLPSQIFTNSLDFEALLQPFAKNCALFNSEMDVALGLLGAKERDVLDRKSNHLCATVKKVFVALIELLLCHAQCRIHLCLGRHSNRRSEHLASSAPSADVAPISLVCKQLAELLRQEWRGFTHTLLATLAPLLADGDAAQLRPFFLVEGASSFIFGLCAFVDNLGTSVGQLDDPQRRSFADTLLCITLVFELLLKSGLPEFQPHPTTSTEPLVRQLEVSHRQLMAQYCRLQGQRLGALVRRALDDTDWLSAAAPTSVSPMQLQIVAEMARLSQHCGDVVPDAAPAPALPRPANRRTASESGSESAGTPWATSGAKDIASEMEKLFNTKCYSFLSLNAKPKRLERGPLLECILNYAIKCQLECVRSQRFGKEGVQQLQVDTQYIRQAYAVYIRKPKALVEAADDIYAAAQERCVDCQPLPASAVCGIVAQHTSV
eukprot:EG_transcript_4379